MSWKKVSDVWETWFTFLLVAMNSVKKPERLVTDLTLSPGEVV